MLIINLNSRIVNPPIAPDLVAQWESFRLGWDYATAKEPFTSCGNADQKRGYLAACASDAVSMLPANCADRLGF